MMWEALIMLGLTAALVVWDVFLAVDKNPRNTISQIIADSSSRWWVMAYGWGVLGGHWFLPAVWSEPAWLSLGSVTVAAIGLFVLNWRRVEIPRWAALAAGLLHGWLLWGQ